MVQGLPLPIGEWYKSNHDKLNQALSISYDSSREQSTDIIWWPNTHKCYGCGETGHIYQVCPSRHGARKETTSMTGKTWTQITANGPHHQRGPEEKQKDITNNRISNEQQRVSQM